jgi:hypothetical protein
MKKLLFTSIAISLCLAAMAQAVPKKENSFSASGISVLNVNVAWGKIKIEPSATTSTIKVITGYDNFEKKSLNERLSLLQTKVQSNTFYISTPSPADGKFESYDITVQVPASINLILKMERGGDIMVNGITGSIEIDNQNGSAKVEDAANWVTINNFNGEINITFKDLKNTEAVSLITFNGGITVTMPDLISADVTLRTKKNGWIRSDFPVKATDGAMYKNMPAGNYSNNSSQWNGAIGKGGTKIIAITNNGPIELKNLNSMVSSY